MIAWILILSVPASVILLIIWDALHHRRPPQHQQRPWWQFGEDDPIARYTKVLGWYTLVLALATVVSAIVLAITDDTLRRTLVASNRAWLAPIGLHLEKPIKTGETASNLVLFGNVGRAPAINIGHHNEGAAVPAASFAPGPPETAAFRLKDSIHALKLPDNCELAKKEQFGGVSYPTTIEHLQNKPALVDGKFVTEEIENGYGFLVVKGCMTYETMGEFHESRYCFLYNTKFDAMRPPDQHGYWQLCVTDNDAN